MPRRKTTRQSKIALLKKLILGFGIFLLAAAYVSASLVNYYEGYQKISSMKNDLQVLDTRIKELEFESERLDVLKNSTILDFKTKFYKQNQLMAASNVDSKLASQAKTPKKIIRTITTTVTPQKKTVSKQQPAVIQQAQVTQPLPQSAPQPQPAPQPIDTQPVVTSAS